MDAPGTVGSYRYWVTADDDIGLRSEPAGPVTDSLWGAETLAYAAVMTTAPSASLGNAIDALVSSLKSAGVWAKCDWIGLYCLHNAQATRVNLRNPAQIATANGTITFTANQGNAGDGSTGYFGAGVNIDALSQYTQDNAHLGCWTNNDPGASSANCIVGSAGANQLLLPRNASGNLSARVNSSSAFQTGVGGVGTGYSVAVRTGASAVENFKNGSSVGAGTQASAALGSVELWFLRGTTGYATSQVSIVHVGAALTSGEVAAAYSAFGAFRTAVGL